MLGALERPLGGLGLLAVALLTLAAVSAFVGLATTATEFRTAALATGGLVAVLVLGAALYGVRSVSVSTEYW